MVFVLVVMSVFVFVIMWFIFGDLVCFMLGFCAMF